MLWTEDFLIDRQMRVSVNGAYSDWVNVTSGVPQGSVLGSLLFLLYINDIPASVSCKIKLFADDTKIWNTNKTQSECQSLQSDLDLLSKWLDEWLLRFNIDKCHVMRIDRKSKVKYYLEKDNKRRELAESEVERDLGIWVPNDLKVQTQYKKAAAQAVCSGHDKKNLSLR